MNTWKDFEMQKHDFSSISDTRKSISSTAHENENCFKHKEKAHINSYFSPFVM